MNVSSDVIKSMAVMSPKTFSDLTNGLLISGVRVTRGKLRTISEGQYSPFFLEIGLMYETIKAFPIDALV